MIATQRMATGYASKFLLIVAAMQPLLLMVNYLPGLLSLSDSVIQFGWQYIYDKIIIIVVCMALIIIAYAGKIVAMYAGIITMAVICFEVYKATRPLYHAYIIFLIIITFANYLSIFSMLNIKIVGSIHGAVYTFQLIRMISMYKRDPQFPLFIAINIFITFCILDSPFIYAQKIHLHMMKCNADLITDFKAIVNIIPNPIIIFSNNTHQIAYYNKSAIDTFTNINQINKFLLSSLILSDNSVTRHSFNSKFYNLTACPLKSNTFTSDCTLVSITDVTEITRAEKEIASENAKWMFVNIANHQIRTPLSGIESSLYLLKNTLQESNNKTEMLKYLKSSTNSVTALRHLVDDTILFCDDTNNKLLLFMQPFKMEEICTEIMKTLELETYGKNIEFIIESFDFPYYLVGDKKRITHIIYTLISNAFKYTVQGKILLRYEVSVNQDNACIHLQVVDTGIGMSKQEVDSLFKIFVDSDINKLNAKPASGISLHVAKRLCELMGGSINCKSTPNAGSIFSVTLYMKCNHICSKNEKENKKLLSIAPEPSVNVSFDVAGFSKVLVVDDNTANLFILSMMLNKLQTKCDQAHNGMEAVNMFASMSYKLVLMDINMPVMNGYEASKRIKQYSQSKNFNVTIVAVSAQDEPNESSLISSNGIDLWVIKPISLSKLKEILQTHQII